MKNKAVKMICMWLLICGSMLHNTASLQAQCTVCRTSVESLDGDDTAIKKGVNNGILYLMGIPYVILVGTIWLAIRYHKAQKREEELAKDKNKIDDTPLA